MFRLLVTMLLVLHLNDATALAQRVDYQKDVKPILQHKCYACHGVLKQQGNLQLDTGASLIRGGDSGSTIDVTQRETSLLYRASNDDEDDKLCYPSNLIVASSCLLSDTLLCSYY